MRAFAIVLALAILLVATVARAQSSSDALDTSAARALFQEGVALARDGAFEAATDRFRRAQAIHPSPSVAYNLASALVHEGNLVEALEIFESVLRDSSTSASLATAARRQRDDVSPRIARITLRVAGDRGEDLRVEIDAHELHDAALGVSVPVDPGVHDVRAMRGGQVAVRDRIVLTEGESREVELVLPRTEVLPSTPLETPSPPAEPEDPPAPAPQPSDETGAWIGIGVGVSIVTIAAIVTASVLLAMPGPTGPVSGTTTPTVLTW